MDVDPNYDPSDFLMAGLPMSKNEDLKMSAAPMEDHDVGIKIHDDLAMSESDEEASMQDHHQQQQQMQEDDDGGDLWF